MQYQFKKEGGRVLFNEARYMIASARGFDSDYLLGALQEWRAFNKRHGAHAGAVNRSLLQAVIIARELKRRGFLQGLSIPPTRGVIEAWSPAI